MTRARTPWRLGYRDGSGADTVTAKVGRKRTGILVPWSTKGCGCCAGEADDADRATLAWVVACANACGSMAAPDDPAAAIAAARRALVLARTCNLSGARAAAAVDALDKALDLLVGQPR